MQMFSVRAAKWLPFVFAAALLCGAVLEAQTLGLPSPTGGDCTATSSGAVACTKTNGTAFAPSATTDTTNAANITSGTLNASRLPAIPAASVTGLAPSATTDTTNAANITSGTLNASRLPAIPAASVTGLAPSATTDTTNAANISSGTLNAARLPAIPLANLQPLVMDTAGLLGLYRFDETGGNLLDYSGNGNHGVIATAPVRSGVSYQFTSTAQGLDWPAALNATNTYYLVVTMPTTPGGQSAYQSTNLSTILSSTATTSAGLLINTKNPIYGPFAPESALPGTYSLSYGTPGYSSQVFTGDVFSGTHVVALSCPSSGAGTFFLDGVPLVTQSGTASCYNVQTAGSFNYRLGQPTNASGLFPQGVAYWAAAFYSTSDSAAVVAKRSLALRQYAMAKGAPFPGQPQVPSMFARLIGQGDSIMCGYGISDGRCTTSGGGTSPNSYMALLPALLNNTYAVSNFGVPSAWMQDTLAAAPVLVDPQGTSNFGQNLAVLATATNNFNTATTYPFVWSLQTAWANSRAQAGLRPVLVGVTSRGGSGCNGNQNCDAVVQAMNAVQRSGWRASKFVGYVDVGSDPVLGATGASMNPGASSCNAGGTITTACTFFWDNLHLYNAGQTRMAQALACVLNGIDGSNAANLNGTVLTANATLTCADGGRYADPTNGAVALTLWSAMWQTGREISYCNVSSSTSNALTLNAPTDFPFSNVSGRTSVTVAPNSCVRFRATFNGNPAAPGNYWMQM
ncbi:hypothetical protein [Terriglobus sp.]|uniref:hypothetical protein n=1 Tax=Terriglobus sp. TaxID=1889013 RepID=UPI003B000587